MYIPITLNPKVLKIEFTPFDVAFCSCFLQIESTIILIDQLLKMKY